MKHSNLRPLSSRRSGFTLVELLVVIGIIAILAATTLSVGSNMIKYAKRTKAANTATQIQTAVLSYYTEYSVYPVVSGTTTDVLIGDSNSTDGASWAVLDSVLCGNISPSTGATFTPSGTNPTNTRNIAFLSFKVADVYSAADHSSNANAVVDAPKNPLPTSTTANLYFNIAMDGDYSGVIGNTGDFVQLPSFAGSSSAAPATTGGITTSGVAVWANCNASTTLTASSGYVHTF